MSPELVSAIISFLGALTVALKLWSDKRTLSAINTNMIQAIEDHGTQQLKTAVQAANILDQVEHKMKPLIDKAIN